MSTRFNAFQTMTITPRTFPQMDLFDVEGNVVNVNQLASDFHLILITLKNTTCPACPQLLRVLNVYGLDPDQNTFIDPFTHEIDTIDNTQKRFYRLLLKLDAYFIILCPGTNAQVRQVQQQTPFMDYPFISTEGGANSLVKALKVRISDQEFMPAILEVSEGNLFVDCVYIGRGPGQYFHQFLLKRLIDDRCKQESVGITCLRHARELINQLKRRSIKCQEGNLVSTWMSLHSNHVPDSPSKPAPEVMEGTTQIEKRFNDLPAEMLEMILSSYCLDIPLLVKASRTCRAFYVAVCNEMMMRLRTQMTWLKTALPHLHGDVIYTDSNVADESLDRWSGIPEGIAYRDLCRRVTDTQNLLVQISHFTRHWSPRRMRSSK